MKTILIENSYIGILFVILLVLFILRQSFKDKTKCPNCKSKHLTKLFPVYEDTLHDLYKCNNCGYDILIKK